MKKRRTQILIHIALASALLFNQVGLHFFHDRHEAHEFYSASKKDQAMFLNHGEHCQVCSLEVLFHAVLPVSNDVAVPGFVCEYHERAHTEFVFTFSGRPSGRAPPKVA
jgi:hypothetical protein